MKPIVRPHLLISRLLAVAAVVMAVGVPCPPAAALTLKQAVDSAIARSPEVSGLSSQIDVARAREDFAGHGNQPQVSVDGGAGGEYSNLLGRGSSAQMRQDVGANLTQRLWDWQRTGLGVQAAAKRTEAAKLDVELARDKLAFTTAEAYLNVIRRRLLLRQTQLNITYHRWLVDSARERVARNQLAKARLTELEARLAPLTVQRIEQEAELERAATTLMVLCGNADNMSMPAELEVDPRATTDTEAWVTASLAQHPAIKRGQLLVEAASQDLESLRAQYLPEVDANLSTRYLDNAEGLQGLQWDNLAMVRLNWSLFGQGVPAQIREAEATKKVADAQLAQARQEITLDLKRYAATLRALEEQDRILVGYQQAAKFSMEAGMEYFKKTAHFATDMLALADLINIRYEAESNLISNHIDRQIAELQLLQSSGHLVSALDQASHS